MKKILLFIILLTSLNFGQSGELILFDDGANPPATTTLYYVSTISAGDSSADSWANAKRFDLFDYTQVDAKDTIYFDGGIDSLVYNLNAKMIFIDVNSKNGTASDKIVMTKGIDAGHNGRVQFVSSIGSGWRCILLKRDYWEISYMDFRGYDTVAAVVEFSAASNSILKYCNIENPKATGLRLSNSYNCKILNNSIKTNKIVNSTSYATDGIFLGGGGGHEIAYNTVRLQNSDTIQHKDIIQGSFYGNSDTTKIHNNLFVQNPDSGDHCGGLYFANTSGNFQIKSNVIINTGGLATGISIDKDAGSNLSVVIDSNTIIGNGEVSLIRSYGYSYFQLKYNQIYNPAGTNSLYLDNNGTLNIDYNDWYVGDTAVFVWNGATTIGWGIYKATYGADANSAIGTDLIAWYRGDYKLNSSGWVDSWANYDLHFNHANWTPNLTGFKNGTPTALFDGSTDRSDSVLFSTNGYTIYMVVKNGATHTNFDAFCDGGGDGLAQIRQGATSGVLQLKGNNAQAFNESVSLGNWTILVGQNDGSATQKLWTQVNNNAKVGGTAVSNYNMAGFKLGANFSNSLLGTFEVAEIMIFNGFHDATQIASVLKYLNAKYKIY